MLFDKQNNMNLSPNTLLQGGKYKIINQLGQGGFGITYLAIQTALDRKVAVKEFFMSNCCQRNEETTFVTMADNSIYGYAEPYKRKFIKEAKTIAALDNQHIIRIHDVFEEYGTAYYVMEYLEGGDLKSRTPDNGITEADAIKIICQIAEALKYIHRRNILHLDIKPSNILFREDGTAVLIDFGISKHYDESDGNETSSTPIGISDGYAPLEQYDNAGMNAFAPTSDIYSLGATLFFLLTGQRPPNASAILNQGMPVLPLSVTEKTANLVTKAMAVRKIDRPQSVSEFLSLLDGTQDTDKGSDVITHNDSNKIVSIIEDNDKIIKEGFNQVLDNVSYSQNKQNRVNHFKKGFLWFGLVCIIVALSFGINYMLEKNGEVQQIGVTTDDSDYDIVAYLPKDLTTAPNGVYAVNKEGKGVPIEFADESCIAVALIVNDAPVPQRFMIEKNGTKNIVSIKAAYKADGATNMDYNAFYWGVYDKDQKDIQLLDRISKNSANWESGYLPKEDGSYSNEYHNLSSNISTWTSGTALGDFNGKANTAALLITSSKTNVNNKYANMITWCSRFNNTPVENQGYNDWYIPSLGQLGLICLNLRSINIALTKIEGQIIEPDIYWSSSKSYADYGWYISFYNNYINDMGNKNGENVRFVRDI